MTIMDFPSLFLGYSLKKVCQPLEGNDGIVLSFTSQGWENDNFPDPSCENGCISLYGELHSLLCKECFLTTLGKKNVLLVFGGEEFLRHLESMYGSDFIGRFSPLYEEIDDEIRGLIISSSIFIGFDVVDTELLHGIGDLYTFPGVEADKNAAGLFDDLYAAYAAINRLRERFGNEKSFGVIGMWMIPSLELSRILEKQTSREMALEVICGRRK